jgi:hypothetical protein
LPPLHSGSNVRFGENTGSKGEDDITTRWRSSYECVVGEPRTSAQVEGLVTYQVEGRICLDGPFDREKCPCGVSG